MEIIRGLKKLRKSVVNMKKNIFVLSILFFLCNCNSTSDPLRKFLGSYRNYSDVNGKIKNGRFYDPYDRFS